MDAQPIPASALYASLGSTAAPVVADVRRGPAFEADDAMIAGEVHDRTPAPGAAAPAPAGAA